MSSVMVVRMVPTPLVGSCGEVRDRQFDALEADLDWLEVSGVPVERIDPTTRPDALAAAPDADRAWKAEGRVILPMVVIGGHVVSRGTFPSRSQLAHLVSQHRSVHSLEMVRHVAALGATAAVGTDHDMARERELARDSDVEDDDIEVAIETGRHVAHARHHPVSR